MGRRKRTAQAMSALGRPSAIWYVRWAGVRAVMQVRRQSVFLGFVASTGRSLVNTEQVGLWFGLRGRS